MAVVSHCWPLRRSVVTATDDGELILEEELELLELLFILGEF